jgi:putative hydrolase of the HAD superfamily
VTPRTKRIIFDLFGVLITEGHLVSNGLIHLLPADTDKKQLKQLYHAYDAGLIDETGFWQGLGLDNYSALRQQFLDLFELDTEFEQTITALKQHYELAILSNFPPDWADTLSRKFNFPSYFSPIIFSGHVACKKPEPAIYQHLANISNTPLDAMVFIDDKLENLQTAHELGMTTVFFQRENDPHPYQPDFTIKSLHELVTILIPE